VKLRIAIAIAPLLLTLLGCDATEAAERAGAIVAKHTEPGRLETRVREVARSAPRATWVSWDAPVNDARANLCCFDSFDAAKKNDWRGGRCSLEGSSGFFSSHGDDGVNRPAIERTHFSIFLRAEGGTIGEVRAFSTDCTVDTGSAAVERLGVADPEESVRLLARLVDELEARPSRRGSEGRDEAEHAIAAIAMHRATGTIPTLVALVESDRDEELRGHAAFWLGMKGGREGLRVLSRTIDSTPSSELREQAIAGIAQDESDASVELLLSLAKGHRTPDAREHALFWLAEKAGEKVAGELEAATDDPDEEVREMAVFSISRLPSDQSVPKLIELARSHRSPGVREQAVFWLGQSADPRAFDFIEEILTK
jgi:hypothetical protein